MTVVVLLVLGSLASVAPWDASDGTCNASWTTAQSAGPCNELFYFEKHNVDCSGRALAQYTLDPHTHTEFAFNYTCCDQASRSCRSVQTAPADDGCGCGGVNACRPATPGCGCCTRYLSSHNIACESDEFLSQVKMVSDSGGEGGGNPGQLHYDYTCCVLPSDMRLQCDNYTTTPDNSGICNAHNIDKHDIKCNASQVLQRFQMKSTLSDQGLIWYNYTCCDVVPVPYHCNASTGQCTPEIPRMRWQSGWECIN